MSFGFAVGDFLAVGRLIYDITNALRGSRAEYQELVRELERYTPVVVFRLSYAGIAPG